MKNDGFSYWWLGIKYQTMICNHVNIPEFSRTDDFYGFGKLV